MWAVVELRRGDIVQTYGVYVNRHPADMRMVQLMHQYHHNDSWWKVVTVPNELINPNVEINDLFRIAVRCNWDDDNAIEVVGMYTMQQHLPEEDAYVWTDEVILR